MTKQIQPIDRFTLFETISFLYWKIYKFYKKKGHTKWESGKIAKTVCIQKFGYENYRNWKYRFQDTHFCELYYELKTRGHDRR
jgi:hypothetical protein